MMPIRRTIRPPTYHFFNILKSDVFQCIKKVKFICNGKKLKAGAVRRILTDTIIIPHSDSFSSITKMEQQQVLPSLALQILAGPRKGETLNFRPESIIKIGRVIRGNTLPIKDPGISTKHLSIQFESGNWILTDLDSSNGTVLDNNRIPPNTPFHLRD
jgi:pSer/pThr/pTyr-binding forkhead associated (FHA) protein